MWCCVHCFCDLQKCCYWNKSRALQLPQLWPQSRMSVYCLFDVSWKCRKPNIWIGSKFLITPKLYSAGSNNPPSRGCDHLTAVPPLQPYIQHTGPGRKTEYLWKLLPIKVWIWLNILDISWLQNFLEISKALDFFHWCTSIFTVLGYIILIIRLK